MLTILWLYRHTYHTDFRMVSILSENVNFPACPSASVILEMIVATYILLLTVFFSPTHWYKMRVAKTIYVYIVGLVGWNSSGHQCRQVCCHHWLVGVCLVFFFSSGNGSTLDFSASWETFPSPSPLMLWLKWPNCSGQCSSVPSQL